MQAAITNNNSNDMLPSSNSNYGECRCCLFIGVHERTFGITELRIFMENLNLCLLFDPRLPHLICSNCYTSLNEAQRFRQKVMVTEATLRAIPQVKLESQTSDDAYMIQPSRDDSLEISTVKSENGDDQESIQHTLKFEANSDDQGSIQDAVKFEADLEDETAVKTENESVIETDEKGLICVEPQNITHEPPWIKSMSPSHNKMIGLLPQNSKESHILPHNIMLPQSSEKYIMISPNTKGFLVMPNAGNVIQMPPHNITESQNTQSKNILPTVLQSNEIIQSKKVLDRALPQSNNKPECALPKSNKILDCASNNTQSNKTVERVSTHSNKMLYSHTVAKSKGLPRLAPKPGTSQIPEFSLKDIQFHVPVVPLPPQGGLAQVTLLKRSNIQTPIEDTGSKKFKTMGNEPSCSNDNSMIYTDRKQSMTETIRCRANIILILKHSTIMPFRFVKEGSYKCFYCESSSGHFKTIKQHTEDEHKDGLSDFLVFRRLLTRWQKTAHADLSCIKCRICGEQLENIDILVEHLTETHQKVFYKLNDEAKGPPHGILGLHLDTDKFKCHICEKEFKFFMALSNHMSVHYNSYACQTCAKKFLSHDRLTKHQKVHLQIEPGCTECGRVFKSKKTLLKHQYDVHQCVISKTTKCPECSKIFRITERRQKQEHMEKEHGITKVEYKCDQCDKVYSSEGPLYVHKRQAHSRHAWICQLCGYKTKSTRLFRTHVESHEGIVKKFGCDYCLKTFDRKPALITHIRVHTNDKKHVCSLCSEVFKLATHLKCHIKLRHPVSRSKC